MTGSGAAAVKITKYFQVTNPYETNNFNVNVWFSDVKQISFSTYEQKAAVEINLQSQQSPPENLSEAYQYFVINSSLKDLDINSMVIIFRVKNSWLEQNDFKENEILLQEYAGFWKKLPTNFLNLTDEYAYYEGTAKDFADYSINAEHPKTVVTANNFSMINNDESAEIQSKLMLVNIAPDSSDSTNPNYASDNVESGVDLNSNKISNISQQLNKNITSNQLTGAAVVISVENKENANLIFPVIATAGILIIASVYIFKHFKKRRHKHRKP